MKSRAITWATAAFAAVAFSLSARAEIVIGVAVPSVGPKVELGSFIAAAATVEVARINAAGGVGGEHVSLQVEDDDCSAEGGAVVAAKLVEMKPALVLGHPCSNSAIAAAKVYAAAGIWFVAIGAGHPELTDKRAGPTIFRLSARDDRQASETAAMLLDWLKTRGSIGQQTRRANENTRPDRIAIVHDRTAYARILAEGATSGLKAGGHAPVASEGIVAGEKSYSATVDRLKATSATILYFAGFPAEFGVIRREIVKSGLDISILGSDTTATDKIVAAATTGLANPQLASFHVYQVMMADGGFKTTAIVQRAIAARIGASRDIQEFAERLNVDPKGDAREPGYAIGARADPVTP